MAGVLSGIAEVISLWWREALKEVRPPPSVDEARVTGLLISKYDTVASSRTPPGFKLSFTNTSGVDWVLKAFVLNAYGLDAVAQWTGSVPIPRGVSEFTGVLTVAHLQQTKGTVVSNPEIDHRGNLYQPDKDELRRGVTECRMVLVTEGPLGRRRTSSALAGVDRSNPSEALSRFALQERFPDIPFDVAKLSWRPSRDLPKTWGQFPTVDTGHRSPTSIVKEWRRKNEAFLKSLLPWSRGTSSDP